MKTIWKYPVPVDDHFELRMPAGAKPLLVELQHGKPQMWALVDPKAPTEMRHFRVFGTGHPVPDDQAIQHVGSFQLLDGDLVFHVFESQGVAA